MKNIKPVAQPYVRMLAHLFFNTAHSSRRIDMAELQLGAMFSTLLDIQTAIDNISTCEKQKAQNLMYIYN